MGVDICGSYMNCLYRWEDICVLFDELVEDIGCCRLHNMVVK